MPGLSFPPPPPASTKGKLVCEWALPSALPLVYTIIELMQQRRSISILGRGQFC